MSQVQRDLLDPGFLQKLEYLAIVARRLFRGQLLAQRRTLKHGAGVEFADHREYTPGDDYRYLDWHIYARHEELLLKRFHEEEDLHVYVLLDVSKSMTAWSEDKLWYGKSLAAALAYIALSEMDRVAVLTFANSVVAHVPLSRGKARIMNILQFLQKAESAPGVTDLKRTVTWLVDRRLRQGVVIIISDFFDAAGFAPALDVLRYHRYDPHVIQIYTEAEANPELLGDLELVDCESGEQVQLTVDESVLRRYRDAFRWYQQSMMAYCRRHGIPCTQATTSVPFDELLLQMMRRSGALE